ncbi:MAG: GYD domain-containing protein [Desulfatiglandales bacterium]
MATFCMFGSYSAEACKGISAERTQKGSSLVKKYGGEIRSMYALLGEKDLIFIVDFPGTEQAMKASVGISKLTGISFTTLPAVPVEDFDKMMSEI